MTNEERIRRNTEEVRESAKEVLLESAAGPVPYLCDCSRCIQERQARHEQDCRRLERESDQLSAEHEAFTLAKLSHEAAALGVDVPSGPDPEVPAVLQEIYDKWRWDESACQWVIVEDGEPEATCPYGHLTNESPCPHCVALARAAGCTCEDPTPRPALEHRNGCPKKLTFYGAPAEWGIGKGGEERRNAEGVLFSFGSPGTWVPNYFEKPSEPPPAPKPETWRDRAIRDPLL